MSEDRETRKARVISLVLNGHTFTEVAELVEISRNSVAGIMYRHHNPDVKTSRRTHLGRLSVARAADQSAA